MKIIEKFLIREIKDIIAINIILFHFSLWYNNKNWYDWL